MSAIDHKPITTDALTTIEVEIQSAANDCRAISRQMLAEKVQAVTGMNHSDATNLVNQYCDEQAPAVPHYLQEEFAIPYLKVVAVLNVIVGVGAIYWGIVEFQKTRALPWPWLCIGTIFIGLGALAWVKSLERFAERKRRQV